METASVRWPSAGRRRTAGGRRYRCRRSPRISASPPAPAAPPAAAPAPPPAPWPRRRRATPRTPASACAPLSPPFDGTSRRSIGELLRTRDVGVQLPDETVRDLRRIAAGTERVVPLAIAQSGQQGGRPFEIGGHDPAAIEFRMPAVIAEGHEAVVDSGDEGLAFEPLRVIPTGREPSALAERRSQIADDIP